MDDPLGSVGKPSVAWKLYTPAGVLGAIVNFNISTATLLNGVATLPPPAPKSLLGVLTVNPAFGPVVSGVSKAEVTELPTPVEIGKLALPDEKATVKKPTPELAPVVGVSSSRFKPVTLLGSACPTESCMVNVTMSPGAPCPDVPETVTVGCCADA